MLPRPFTYYFNNEKISATQITTEKNLIQFHSEKLYVLIAEREFKECRNAEEGLLGGLCCYLGRPTYLVVVGLHILRSLFLLKPRLLMQGL